jgi:predicted metal-dependent phosphoesterase TrpH
MAWKPVDCHAHSTMSDGALDVPQLIERVTGRGVRPSVSDQDLATSAGPPLY